jgi:hypothetical protein
MDPDRRAIVGIFRLRRVPGSAPLVWEGDLDLLGFPYVLTAEVETDRAGAVLVGRVRHTPALRQPGRPR